MQRNKLIGMVIVILLIGILNGLMFGILCPQDNYVSTIGTVTKGINNATVLSEDMGIVEYYVDYVKYEHRFGSFMFNAHRKGDKYLIRYREGDPTKVRSHLFPLFMALTIFGEVLLVVNLFFLISSLIFLSKKDIPREKEDWERAKRINERHGLISKIKFGLVTFILVVSILFVFISQPLYNSTRNYDGGLYNYSIQNAQQLVCEKDKYTAYITQENNELYYLIKPVSSKKYIMDLAPPIKGHYEVLIDNKTALCQGDFEDGIAIGLNLIKDETYLIKLIFDYKLSNELAVILSIRGE